MQQFFTFLPKFSFEAFASIFQHNRQKKYLRLYNNFQLMQQSGSHVGNFFPGLQSPAYVTIF